MLDFIVKELAKREKKKKKKGEKKKRGQKKQSGHVLLQLSVQSKRKIRLRI